MKHKKGQKWLKFEEFKWKKNFLYLMILLYYNYYYLFRLLPVEIRRQLNSTDSQEPFTLVDLSGLISFGSRPPFECVALGAPYVTVKLRSNLIS